MTLNGSGADPVGDAVFEEPSLTDVLGEHGRRPLRCASQSCGRAGSGTSPIARRKNREWSQDHPPQILPALAWPPRYPPHPRAVPFMRIENHRTPFNAEEASSYLVGLIDDLGHSRSRYCVEMSNESDRRIRELGEPTSKAVQTTTPTEAKRAKDLIADAGVQFGCDPNEQLELDEWTIYVLIYESGTGVPGSQRARGSISAGTAAATPAANLVPREQAEIFQDNPKR